MIKTQVFRNIVLPFILIIDSFRKPYLTRFNRERKLLMRTRIILIAFVSRFSFLVSAVIALGTGSRSYFIILSIAFVCANIIAGISLLIGVGIRNIFSRIAFGVDSYHLIVHPVAMGHLVGIIPTWLLPKYMSYSILLVQIALEMYFARKSSKMKWGQITVVFVITRIVMYGLSMLLRTLRNL